MAPYELQTDLPAAYHSCPHCRSLIYLMILLTSLAIVTVSIYYYAALTAALLGAFVVMQQFYLPAATILKRWAGETASSVRRRWGEGEGKGDRRVWRRTTAAGRIGDV